MLFVENMSNKNVFIKFIEKTLAGYINSVIMLMIVVKL